MLKSVSVTVVEPDALVACFRKDNEVEVAYPRKLGISVSKSIAKVTSIPPPLPDDANGNPVST